MFPTQLSLTLREVGGLLVTAGQRRQFSSPCGPTCGGGAVDNSLLLVTWKPGFTPTSSDTIPDEEEGASFWPGGNASPGSHMVSMDTAGGWEMGAAHCLVG